MDKWTPPISEEKRNAILGLHDEDLDNLYDIGLSAARKAGIKAFWIDVLCMDAANLEEDANRICDVARGANRVVIALNNDMDDRIRDPDMEQNNINALLQRWSSRMWTLPEMLLAPIEHNIAIYNCIGTKVHHIEDVPKRNMAERAYLEDGHLVRQLVDHFESSIHLTQTELLTIGLECLIPRSIKGTKAYASADPIYALMTLARRRPHPVQGDSIFEAFAKLSLPNDSDMLLERLVCLLNPRRGSPWHQMDDFWRAKLWDISPTCQVAGIDENQTVTLDGAHGATITWDRLDKVGFLKRRTPMRVVAQVIIVLAPVWLANGIPLLVIASRRFTAAKQDADYGFDVQISPVIKTMLALGIVFTLLGAVAAILAPWFLLSLYRGKFWETEARLFGLEGVPDLGWLEEQLFGFDEGRLQWSPYSSTQSRHRRKVAGEYLDNECQSDAPSDRPLLLETEYGASAEEAVDEARLFTVVDTYTMQVTTFWAVHPPSVALVCGHEGGMRRALLCSYDYKTQTFHRETVLRVPTKMLDRMDRVERFRFSLEPRKL